MKNRIIALIVAAILCICALSSCGNGDNVSGKNGEKIVSDIIYNGKNEDAENTVYEEANPSNVSADTTNVVTIPDTTSDTSDESILDKAYGYADDSGIYAFSVTLNDDAADKGEIEFIYYGTKGSTHENVIICTYHTDYWKENGKFETKQTYDGKIDINQHAKNKVEISCTFGALVRAGSVIVYYTPDGGEKTEVFMATADAFR